MLLPGLSKKLIKWVIFCLKFRTKLLWDAVAGNWKVAKLMNLYWDLHTLRKQLKTDNGIRSDWPNFFTFYIFFTIYFFWIFLNFFFWYGNHIICKVKNNVIHNKTYQFWQHCLSLHSLFNSWFSGEKATRVKKNSVKRIIFWHDPLELCYWFAFEPYF